MPIVNATFAEIGVGDNAPAVSVPSGGASGDFYVMAILASSDITFPAGFTALTEFGEEATLGSRLEVAVKAYDGSEGASFTGSTASYGRWAVACALVRGGTTRDAQNVVGAYIGYTNAGVALALPSVGVTIPAGSSHEVIYFGGSAGAETGAVSASASPTGFDAVTGVAANTDGFRALMLARKLESGSGSTTYSGATFTFAGGSARSGHSAVVLFTTTGGGGGGGGARLLLLGVG